MASARRKSSPSPPIPAPCRAGPGREEFRATGGSLHFLKRQDVSVGSERVRIEVRDRETGLVLESRELNPQQAYDFDPFQGRITLLKPLASTAASASTVREGSSTGDVPVLVVRYEYTPPVGDLDGYTLGGRSSLWLGESLRLGATAQRDTVDAAAQTLLGADAMYRITAGTYLKAEIAQTKGPGYGEGSEAYVGYALHADRTDTGLDPQNVFTRSNRGTLTLGVRQRFSDSLSVFGENRVGIGGSAPSLTRSKGLRFDPTKRLSVTGSFENGRIDDATTGVFRRTATSLAVGYTAEYFRAGSSIELRDEVGANVNQAVWLLRNNLSYSVAPDWRVIGELNLARANNESPSVRAAEFTEAMAGLAWRPVDNERINALLRLQYFEDLGPVGQLTGSGETQSPKQVSTVASLDVNYDLSERLTLGVKYGYRQGKVSLGRDSDAFVSSDAHLAVVRLDCNVARLWDVLAEGRALWVMQADDKRLGALGAIYRHLGNNVKLGVGYSWSDFSDDITDQSYSSQGPFLNLLGKF